MTFVRLIHIGPLADLCCRAQTELYAKTCLASNALQIFRFLVQKNIELNLLCSLLVKMLKNLMKGNQN